MTSSPRSPRLVLPRRQMMTTSLAALGLSGTALAAFGQEAGEGGEGGEGAAMAGLDPRIEALTHVGLYEATHRIAVALLEEGNVALAQEHVQSSHHAFYDDVAEALEVLDGVGFAPTSAAFAAALEAGNAAPALEAGRAVLDGCAAIAAAAPAAEQMAAIEALLRVAAADYEGGVQDGTVVLDIEYRDAWGFTRTARAWTERLAASDDAAVAGAGAAALQAFAPADALFPALTATAVPGADPSVLLGLAARVEIAALRLG